MKMNMKTNVSENKNKRRKVTFFEGNIIPNSKYLKNNRGKKTMTQLHIMIHENILNEILADQIQ